MLFYMLLIAFFAYAMAGSEQNVRNRMKDEVIGCQPTNPVDMNELNKLQNLETPTNKETKCLLKCVYQNWGMLAGDGTFDMDETLAKVGELTEDQSQLEIFRDIAGTCVNNANGAVSGDDPNCDRYAAFFGCIIETSKERGYSF